MERHMPKHINISVPDEMHKELKRHCAQNETDMNEVVRGLIADFLRKTKKNGKKKKPTESE